MDHYVRVSILHYIHREMIVRLLFLCHSDDFFMRLPTLLYCTVGKKYAEFIRTRKIYLNLEVVNT